MKEARTRANLLFAEALGPSLDRIRGTLRDLGLGGPATEAFCALVRMPTATAGDLVRKTGIPDSKIYYALDELVERGLVEVQGGKPKTFRVVPTREVEARLARLAEAEFETRRAAATRVGSLLEPLRAAATTEATDIAYIVKGLPNILARAQALVGSARREIVVLASDEKFFRRIEEDLTKAIHRRVRVRLAVPDMPLAEDLAKAAEIRSIVCACMLLVVDRQQVLTASRTQREDAYAITSTDETLVQLGLDYWESPRCCIECE
jgi:sugar-specific transcriptional regulator TrmB